MIHNIVVVVTAIGYAYCSGYLQVVESVIASGNIVGSAAANRGLMSDVPLEQMRDSGKMLEIAYGMGVSRDYDPFMTGFAAGYT